jgi:hypothetical protein
VVVAVRWPYTTTHYPIWNSPAPRFWHFYGNSLIIFPARSLAFTWRNRNEFIGYQRSPLCLHNLTTPTYKTRAHFSWNESRNERITPPPPNLAYIKYSKIFQTKLIAV